MSQGRATRINWIDEYVVRGEGGRRLNLAPSEAIDLGVALTHYAERAKSGWA